MTTSVNPTEKSILLKIARNLVKAQQELDEIAVQLALGKAEATDKFEEIKKEFANRVTAIKQILKSDSQKEIFQDLNSKLSTLESELESGKAETKVSFEDQKKKILAAITTIENVLKAKFTDNAFVDDMVNEFEKFKLKLEIIRLRFVLKKFEIKDDFRSGMSDARKEISKIMSGAKGKLKKAKSTYTNFRGEISESYQHMRNAVRKIHA